jgi:hypothetical protein
MKMLMLQMWVQLSIAENHCNEQDRSRRQSSDSDFGQVT